MLTLTAATGRATTLRVLPAANALVSWTTGETTDTLELIVDTVDGRRSRALPYVAFEPGRRASLDGFDEVARIATDIVRAERAIAAIEVHTQKPLRTVAASTPGSDPPRTDAAPIAAARRELAVPEHSQYLTDFPAQRGWCAPASLAMLLGAHGIGVDVAEAAAGVFDHAYDGTGNWSFAIAYAGMCGLTGAPAYLRDLTTLEQFIAAGLPVAASIAWQAGQLPGAPLDHSGGHILVVRGFAANGDVIVNDPAQPAVRHVYDRAAFAACWLTHGGVALLVAPPGRSDDLVRCANA
jgi:Peptidase_C39 like family